MYELGQMGSECNYTDYAFPHTHTTTPPLLITIKMKNYNICFIRKRFISIIMIIFRGLIETIGYLVHRKRCFTLCDHHSEVRLKLTRF